MDSGVSSVCSESTLWPCRGESSDRQHIKVSEKSHAKKLVSLIQGVPPWCVWPRNPLLTCTCPEHVAPVGPASSDFPESWFWGVHQVSPSCFPEGREHLWARSSVSLWPSERGRAANTLAHTRPYQLKLSSFPENPEYLEPSHSSESISEAFLAEMSEIHKREEEKDNRVCVCVCEGQHGGCSLRWEQQPRE